MGKVIDHNNFWYIEKNPISKTGVFPYLGREIGLPGLIPDKLYNVLRSEKELMSPEAMKSFELLPITKGHKMLGPSEEGFTPAEKIPQQGIVGEKVFAEGDTLYANIKVTSEQAKEDINNGLKELSLGYFCQWAKESGQYKGQPYDIVQKNIRGNHLAIVPLGRMGHSVRVMDALPQSAGSYACDSLELAGPLVGNSPKHSLRVFAEDEERWITIHPNGEENKGRPLKLEDGETPAAAINRVYGTNYEVKSEEQEQRNLYRQAGNELEQEKAILKQKAEREKKDFDVEALFEKMTEEQKDIFYSERKQILSKEDSEFIKKNDFNVRYLDANDPIVKRFSEIVGKRRRAEAVLMRKIMSERKQPAETVSTEREKADKEQETLRQTRPTYINVPFDDKDEAKALGARWDAVRRSWYIPEGISNEQFCKWQKKEAEQTGELKPIKTLASGFNVAKETKKAYLLEKEGKKFWVQKRWVRPDGTLTEAGQNSYEVVKSIGSEEEYIQKELAEAKEAVEKQKAEGVSFHQRGETENAVYTYINFYEPRTEYTFSVRVFIPKSMIKNGKAPYWLMKQKQDEAWEQAYMKMGNAGSEIGIEDRGFYAVEMPSVSDLRLQYQTLLENKKRQMKQGKDAAPQTKESKDIYTIIGGELYKILPKDLSSKQSGADGISAAPEIKENAKMDKRKAIKEIMALVSKPATEFEGGEEEKVRTIAGLAEKLAYNKSESGANDAKCGEEDKEKAKAEDNKTSASKEEVKPEETKAKEEKGKAEDAMEAAIAARFAKKMELYEKVSPFTGTFDHTPMTLTQMAKYSCEKLGIKGIAEDSAEAALMGYLAGAKKDTFVRETKGVSCDSMPATDAAFEEYLKEAK